MLMRRGVDSSIPAWSVLAIALCDIHLQTSKDLQPLVSEWIDHQIPAHCLAEVTDLQTAIVFMASPASNYMVSGIALIA